MKQLQTPSKRFRSLGFAWFLLVLTVFLAVLFAAALNLNGLFLLFLLLGLVLVAFSGKDG